MPPAAAASDGMAAPSGHGREGGTRSGRNVHSAYMVKAGGDAHVKPANWNATALGKRQRSDKSDSEDGTTTPGPNTPATTNSGGTPAKLEKAGGGAGADVKQQRAAWSSEAVALGYEAGTIKNSAYLLLAASGSTGMTVAAIVEAATKQG